MKTQTIYVDACTSTGIAIGRRNTYATEQIVFGLAPLVQQYGAGSAVLMVLRPTDTTPYPAVTSQSGTELTWTVSATDTSVPGTGECELYWYVDGGLAKSVIFPLTIQRDIITEPIDEPPEPYQTWVDDLTELGAETLQNAQAAAQSATDAELSKEASEDAAERAEEALEEFTTPTASAVTLNPGEPATASYSEGHFTFGIPKGAKGDKGNTGETYMLAPSVDTIVKNPDTGTFIPAQIIFTVYKVVNGTSSPYRAAAIVADIFGSGMVPHYEVVNDYRLTVPINSIADTGYVACSAYGNGGIIATITIPCILDGAKGDPGEGVASGGTTGQFLKKKSGADYDTEWADVDPGVTSVNGKTGAVTLTASDVGAKPASYEAPVSSVNEKTGAVVLDAGDIGYDGETTYPDASVGKELGTINSALTSLSSVTEIIDTASGAIASFPDGSGLPIRSLVAEINPVQDLHGYANPWPAGGGVNKYPNTLTDVKAFNVAGTWNGNSYTYKGLTFACTSDNNDNITSITVNGTNEASRTDFTLGSVTLPAGNYIVNGCPVPTSGKPYWIGSSASKFSDEVGNGSSLTLEEETTFSPPSQDGLIGIRIAASITCNNVVFKPMIRLSTVTDATFAPYSNICPISGHTGLSGWVEDEYDPTEQPTFSVSWQSEAGTVYGGTLDVVSGLLTALDANIILTSSNVTDLYTYDRKLGAKFENVLSQNETRATGLCSHSGKVGSYFSVNSIWVGVNTKHVFWIGILDVLGLTTLDQFKDWLDTQTVQVCYKLSTPQTYQLTPQEVYALLGQNNIWVDTGDVSVTYQASIKGYIDKVLAS